MQLGELRVDGLRGLSIDGFSLAIRTEGGPAAQIAAPSARIQINLADLFYGKITVERIVLDKASIVIERPEDAVWYDPEGFDLREIFDIPSSHGFRITGNDCSLEIRNVVGDTRAEIKPFRFDIARLVDAEELTAKLEGDLSGDGEKKLKVRLTMASFQDFDLRIESTRFTAEDINVFLPAEQHIIQSGSTAPTLWIGARPDNTLLVSLEAPFTDLVIRDQPDFLNPATGNLTAHANYSTESGHLTVTTAKAESSELSGTLEGAIEFDEMYPEFDLRLSATRLPVAQLLDYWGLEGKIEDYGETELTLNEPYEAFLSLTGNSDSPIIGGGVRAASGNFVFAPREPDETRLDLALGMIDVTWNSDTEAMNGTIEVVDGSIRHIPSELEIERTRGTVRIENNRIVADPISAMMTGMPLAGTMSYDISTDVVDLTVSGVLSGLENTKLHDAIRDTLISGDINIRQARIQKRGKRYEMEADIDATSARIDHEWWYTKHAGTGASGTLTVAWIPDESLTIIADAEVASTDLSAKINLVPHSGSESGSEFKWRINSAQASSERIDITALGQCLNLPYRISGGTGYEGRFSWERDQQNVGHWRQLASAHFDELRVLPLDDAAVTPMYFEDLSVDADIVSAELDKGHVTLRARAARMPPMNEPWLLPFDKSPPEGIALKDIERRWRYDLAAENVLIPPWEGTNFRAEAFSNEDDAGFTTYSADIGEGRIDGDFRLTRVDNFYTSSVRWDAVPAATLIAHLGFPEILVGTLSGGIEYKLDQDDPSTLNGQGSFRITDGQFSADYVASLLEGQVEGELSSLPPSLRFSEFTGVVELEKDIVRNPEFSLISDDLRIEGSGHYIRDGDMDYLIRVAVDPDAAARIPALRDNLNIGGHRISNQDIELTFGIAGPIFHPTGRLEELPPVGVTLVSGAIGVTSQVIDFPRRILVDLLKTAGGVLGAGK